MLQSIMQVCHHREQDADNRYRPPNLASLNTHGLSPLVISRFAFLILPWHRLSRSALAQVSSLCTRPFTPALPPCSELAKTNDTGASLKIFSTWYKAIQDNVSSSLIKTKVGQLLSAVVSHCCQLLSAADNLCQVLSADATYHGDGCRSRKPKPLSREFWRAC